jgi:hypothetical protein
MGASQTRLRTGTFPTWRVLLIFYSMEPPPF